MDRVNMLINKLGYCSTVLTSLVLIRYLYSRYSKQKKHDKCEYPLINEVLFFSEKYSLCSQHIDYNSPCSSDDCGLLKLKKIITYLDSATRTLDVCVYSITSPKLGAVILRKFKQGVHVRIITDQSMARGDATQIPLFRKNGILIRARQSTQFLMHHKFAIIDKSLLINGSFNWTSQATFGNWENVYISSYPKHVVQQYCDQFDVLWKQLEDE